MNFSVSTNVINYIVAKFIIIGA